MIASIRAPSLDVLNLNMSFLKKKLIKGGQSQSQGPVVCAPPMRCMCAVTASDSRMSDGLRLQDIFGYIYILSSESLLWSESHD